MKELARRITNRIKLDMFNNRRLTVGKVLSFDGLAELNTITKARLTEMYPPKIEG